MKTELNRFADFYRFENGRVIDERSGKEILPDKQHSFILQDPKGKRKRISQKKLYKALYGTIFCLDDIEDLPNEEWRPIPDSEGKYLISSCGRVKSLNGYKASLLRPMIQKGY